MVTRLSVDIGNVNIYSTTHTHKGKTNHTNLHLELMLWFFLETCIPYTPSQTHYKIGYIKVKIKQIIYSMTFIRKM